MVDVPDRAARKPRADVLKNSAALVDAAKAVFATSGVGAPAKEITDLAGVGVGTLYRRFPRRSDLILAVFRHELDECVAAARTITESHDPLAAVSVWLDRYTTLVATKQGLAEAMHSADPAYDGLPQAVLLALEPVFDGLLQRAIASGDIRSDVRAREVLVAVALLCQPVPQEGHQFNARLVSLFVDGLTAR